MCRTNVVLKNTESWREGGKSDSRRLLHTVSKKEKKIKLPRSSGMQDSILPDCTALTIADVAHVVGKFHLCARAYERQHGRTYIHTRAIEIIYAYSRNTVRTHMHARIESDPDYFGK